MKVEGRLFAAGSVSFLSIAAIYWYTARDPIGTTALTMSGMLAALVAFYVLYTSKRVWPRPEDRLDANIDEADPEYGFFSPHSWWPLVIGVAVMFTALGLVFAVWLIALGVFALVFGLIGWMFEYYRGEFAR